MAPRPQNPTGATTTTVPGAPPVTLPGAPLPPPAGAAAAATADGYTGVSAGYIPPGRTGKNEVPGIIDSTGAVKPYYNLNSSPREILTGMSEINRAKFLKNLYDRGWYKSGKPGGGLSDEDEEAVQRLLYSSNLTGVSWDQVYTLGKKSPFASAETGDGRIRVAATEDLVEIANRTALSTIGRKLSADEASKFSRAYQSSQQTEAAGGMSAPSSDVFFKNRIEQQYGGESDGYKYLSAISNVARLMENM